MGVSKEVGFIKGYHLRVYDHLRVYEPACGKTNNVVSQQV